MKCEDLGAQEKHKKKKKEKKEKRKAETLPKHLNTVEHHPKSSKNTCKTDEHGLESMGFRRVRTIRKPKPCLEPSSSQTQASAQSRSTLVDF